MAMGRYMNAFAELEGMIHLAIGFILDVDLPMMRPVFAVMATRQSIDLLDAVGQTHLTDEGAKRVHHLCDRLIRRNMRRNHIVHGSWANAVIINDGCITQEWVRMYSHAKPAMSNLPYTDPRVAGIYAFTVAELDKATGHVEEMLLAISNLIGDLPSLKAPPQAPGESEGA